MIVDFKKKLNKNASNKILDKYYSLSQNMDH